MSDRLLDADASDPLEPANASPVVAWLASEQSGWLTGANDRDISSFAPSFVPAQR